MLEFELPDGFANDKVAIHIPKEYVLDFLHYVLGLGYDVNIEYIYEWTIGKIEEGHEVYFHYDTGKSIQAFTEQSFFANVIPMLDFESIIQQTSDCTDILTLL